MSKTYQSIVASAKNAFATPWRHDTTVDWRGNAAAGVWAGTAAYAPALYGRGFALNGASSINYASLLPLAGAAKSVFCRYKRTSATGYMWAQTGTGAGQGMRLRSSNPIVGQGLLDAMRMEFVNGYTIASVVDTLDWHSAAVVWPNASANASDLVIYQDGKPIVVSGTLDVVLDPLANPFAIGRDLNASADTFFNGVVAEVYIFTYALSQSEVFILNAGYHPAVSNSLSHRVDRRITI